MDDKHSFSFPRSDSAGGVDYRAIQISDAVLRQQPISNVLAQFALLLQSAASLSAELSSTIEDQSAPRYNSGDLISLINSVASSLEVLAYMSEERVPRDIVRWIKLIKDKSVLLSRIDRPDPFGDLDFTDV